jgi:hypothetical protein
MEKDDLFDAQLADIFDHDGKAFLEDLRVGEMDINDVAEKFLPEKPGGHNVLKEFPFGDILQLRHETKGKGDLPDLAQLNFPFGFPDMNPLAGNARGAVRMPLSSRRSLIR